MSIGIEELTDRLMPAGSPAHSDLRGRLAEWEDLLTLIVDPESPRVSDRGRKRRMLSYLLDRSGLEETSFWKLSRGQRGRVFLGRWSRVSRHVPQLEITSFDIDKVLKERFRKEPLTIGASWHFGFWRAYFSHAAITHPANDGLREEFSTRWDILRKQPAVLFATRDGQRHENVEGITLDMPMIVGPLPHSDGITLERAYLHAIEDADPKRELKTRSLVVVPAAAYLANVEAYAPHLENVMLRLSAGDAAGLDASGSLAAGIRKSRIVELEWPGDLEEQVSKVRNLRDGLLVSVYLRNGHGFWEALERAARTAGVAMIHVHSGTEKSYRLIPRVDAFLKARMLRARVQLVSAGGDTDTQGSAATVYEAVLLGANGGSMTHIAEIALEPRLVDVHHGADCASIVKTYASRDAAELEELATNTLTCWQHSILDFLSCMGIDDVQKTSGNMMAITMTEDWIREVDALATPEFAHENAQLNHERLSARATPGKVRDRFKVTSLLEERKTELPLVHAAKILAQESANWHLENSNHSLSADFLEVIYRMAAGEMPGPDDFFIHGAMGDSALEQVGLKLSRESLEWSLARLNRDPSLLDYISLAVPRGFERPGATEPHSRVQIVSTAAAEQTLFEFTSDARGGFEHRLDAGHELEAVLQGDRALLLIAVDEDGGETRIELTVTSGSGHSVARASADGRVTIRRDPRGGLVVWGYGYRPLIWHAPVCHASISLGAASPDFLMARIEGNVGLSITSSGEGGPIRLSDEAMQWESLQAASGHFGIHGADLRRVNDVEIKINQGAKPGKGGRLSGAKVTSTVSKARNIPVGTDALSPDPKHDIYSIEDMPAEVWLWLMYDNHCGIKITGSNYTRFVAAGMWSNFVVDYLLIDSGVGGSGNYHADSSHVGWPDIFRTILHTHHALVGEKVDDGTGELRSIRDMNGAAYGARGGTRLVASGGLRGELDMIKVLIAGADSVVEASIGKAVAFGCNQCGNCHLDCPRGGITTKPELSMQNDRNLMRQRFRNWTVMNMVKLAVLIDALNRELGYLDETGRVVEPDALFDDIRKLRGRVDLLEMPEHPPLPEPKMPKAQDEHDSCRVGSLAVSEPVSVHAIWEAARLSYNGGNNRGGGIDFAGFVPEPLREKICMIFNTIGPDRVDAMRQMLEHLQGCRFYDAAGGALRLADLREDFDAMRIPVRERYASEDGWRAADLRENPGDFYMVFVDLEPEVWSRYGRTLVESEHWLQRQTKYGDVPADVLLGALTSPEAAARGEGLDAVDPRDRERVAAFVTDVREEYFTALAHVLDSRYYRTHAPAPDSGRKNAPRKYAPKRRGYVVSMGQDLAALKISGWTHTIPEYFDFDAFWANYPGAGDGVAYGFKGAIERTHEIRALVWGMHHRYPTNSPAIDAEGRGNPAGAHPFKAFNVLLMHNGEQVGVDSTSPLLGEFGFVHADPSMGEGYDDYDGDSVYDRKALTDTEYAAYLVDFTRRVLGLTTEEASQIISPITGIDLDAMDEERQRKLRLLMNNYVQLTPTGPYKFTIVESRPAQPADRESAPGRPRRRVGFRENMDIKFLRPHEIIASRDTSDGGVHAVANGSEAKIADSMLRILHQQGVLGDAAADLRFNMRPGGHPGQGDYGGVFEAFTVPGRAALDLCNRFGEDVPVDRAGSKVDPARSLDAAAAAADPEWRRFVDDALDQLTVTLAGAGSLHHGRLFGPGDEMPSPAVELVDDALARVKDVGFDEWRYLAERALPEFARAGDAPRAAALRVLAELRKRLMFSDLGGKALSSMEFLTDGGRSADGVPIGGIYRLLDEVPPLFRVLASPPGGTGRYGRITLASRDDLLPPSDPARDVLVVDFAGFRSESFESDGAGRFVSGAVREGWKHIIGYGFIGGPRYVGTNTATREGEPARGVTLELFGREFGDFIGALLEGADVWVYGQAQSHLGMKADSGRLFVLQDALNTCMYAAHGATVNLWNSGSRFAVAGQNKVYLADGKTPAQGFKSIHFGTPNEYAFEYLMSGGENSMHVVMGLQRPDARGELSLLPKPYAGKFFMSGAAAGRVFVFDPNVKLDPAQYQGNHLSTITADEWAKEVGPFIAEQAAMRGLPIRIDEEFITMRLEGDWPRWRYNEAFAKLIPMKVALALQEKGIVPPQLAQIVAE